jgi:hypothetical protein
MKITISLQAYSRLTKVRQRRVVKIIRKAPARIIYAVEISTHLTKESYYEEPVMTISRGINEALNRLKT